MTTSKEMKKKLECNKEKMTGEVSEKKMQEDIFMPTKMGQNLEFLCAFLVKREEKDKSIIVLVIKWILLVFVAGLLEYWCEPIYEVLTPPFIHQEESIDTEDIIEISLNTKIEVWDGSVVTNIHKKIVVIEFYRTKEDWTYFYWVKEDKCIERGYVERSKSSLEPFIKNDVNWIEYYNYLQINN